jgi:hypothetical protein
MGYNPHRKFTARPSDYVLVAAALLISAGLVVWGFLS